MIELLNWMWSNASENRQVHFTFKYELSRLDAQSLLLELDSLRGDCSPLCQSVRADLRDLLERNQTLDTVTIDIKTKKKRRKKAA